MIALSEVIQPGWELRRDGEFDSLGLCKAAADSQLLTFCGEKKYLHAALKNPQITCILCTAEVAALPELIDSAKGYCIAADLRLSFFRLHNQLGQGKFAEEYVGKNFPSQIGRNCQISPKAEISTENVSIGDNVIIEPFVVIKGHTRIGNNSIIRSGSVLGGEGLEFMRIGKESILPVEHYGWLEIGERVEIQFNCNVSRSLFPWHKTEIGDDCKLESLVHVAHGVKMGQRVLVASSACITGSAIIGDDVWIGPNATISSEVKVGDAARISLGAVVAGNVRPGQSVSGNFAVDHEKFLDNLLRQSL